MESETARRLAALKRLDRYAQRPRADGPPVDRYDFRQVASQLYAVLDAAVELQQAHRWRGACFVELAPERVWLDADLEDGLGGWHARFSQPAAVCPSDEPLPGPAGAAGHDEAQRVALFRLGAFQAGAGALFVGCDSKEDLQAALRAPEVRAHARHGELNRLARLVFVSEDLRGELLKASLDIKLQEFDDELQVRANGSLDLSNLAMTRHASGPARYDRRAEIEALGDGFWLLPLEQGPTWALWYRARGDRTYLVHQSDGRPRA